MTRRWINTQPLLYLKGFHALQAYRIGHWLWNQASRTGNLSAKPVSVTFRGYSPGSKIGRGIMLDHATGIVVGETAVIENDVSILQSVTLGGTGKSGGDRHPKIREGVMIGAARKFSVILKLGAARRLAQVPWCCNRCRRTPLPLAFRHALSASRIAINRQWIWISISTALTIRLSMVMRDLTFLDRAGCGVNALSGLPHLNLSTPLPDTSWRRFIHHDRHRIDRFMLRLSGTIGIRIFLFSGQGIKNARWQAAFPGRTSDNRHPDSLRRCEQAYLSW